MKELANSVRNGVDAAQKWFDRMIRRLMENRSPVVSNDDKDRFKLFRELSSTVSLILVAGMLAVLVWVAVLLYRRYHGVTREKVPVESFAGVFDLESEEIVATLLREDEWMRLAKEQIERGEDRLAVRALFLATLAHLGERGLLKIARFKSNRDCLVWVGHHGMPNGQSQP